MKSPRAVLSLILLTCLLALPAAADGLSAAKRPKQNPEDIAQKVLSNKALSSNFIDLKTHQCNHSDAISCGQTRAGSLSNADCRLDDGTYIDDWTFNGSTGQQLTINLTSSVIDPYLLLLDPAGEIVVQDDDAGDGSNSRIVYTLLSSGTYHIVANSYDDDPAFGDYSLSVACSTCTTTPTAISCNTTQNGSLATTDCTLRDNTYFDEWTFSGTSGQSVVINQASGTLDTYLLLVNPNGQVAAENDDTTGTDSEIRFTLDASGTWRIIATSFDPLDTGSYTLQLQCSGGGGGNCTGSSSQLCLNNDRFRITVNWRDFNGNTGSGNAVELTNDTGYFWFFNAANVELVVKVLDARAVNNRFWVYYGALTNVEYTMTVTDTQTGAVKTYTNPSGTFASAGDVNAFAP